MISLTLVCWSWHLIWWQKHITSLEPVKPETELSQKKYIKFMISVASGSLEVPTEGLAGDFGPWCSWILDFLGYEQGLHLSNIERCLSD